ncbi:hypothetical protein RFH37_01070 [Cutibacterium avidum]|uniref:hypothetical protein n=1 Tax=Cutibacterium avidum TaxID=33010 RepID=UPI0028103379|nr:hypothetical protein [Cutibacterium avidum]MDQ9080178.1 hypothetical protein [Cutibacterium avidum]
MPVWPVQDSISDQAQEHLKKDFAEKYSGKKLSSRRLTWQAWAKGSMALGRLW